MQRRKLGGLGVSAVPVQLGKLGPGPAMSRKTATRLIDSLDVLRRGNDPVSEIHRKTAEISVPPPVSGIETWGKTFDVKKPDADLSRGDARLCKLHGVCHRRHGLRLAQ